jgi:hypothetical protein
MNFSTRTRAEESMGSFQSHEGSGSLLLFLLPFLYVEGVIRVSFSREAVLCIYAAHLVITVCLQFCYACRVTNLGLTECGRTFVHVPIFLSFNETGWRNKTNVALRQRRNCCIDCLLHTCRGWGGGSVGGTTLVLTHPCICSQPAGQGLQVARHEYTSCILLVCATS